MKKLLVFFILSFVFQGFTEVVSREQRELLITGCARSGTTYITAVLQKCGLNVGHEVDNSYGIVSWPMADDTMEQLWGPPAGLYEFKHIFHQVRHPVKVIASFHLANERSWRYVFKRIPQIKIDDKMIVRCAKYWVHWNLRAEKRAEWTYRVEDIENALPEMARRLGVTLDSAVLAQVSKNTNPRAYHVELSWEILYKTLNRGLYMRVVSLAKRYGYDVSEALALIES